MSCMCLDTVYTVYVCTDNLIICIIVIEPISDVGTPSPAHMTLYHCTPAQSHSVHMSGAMSCDQFHCPLWEGGVEEVEVAEVTGKLVDVLHKAWQVLHGDGDEGRTPLASLQHT